MVITLIGYRGCGKTTVARQLARLLEWEHVDADEEIERVAGRTIRQIFAESGEPEFRARERDVMAGLLRRNRIVVSAGGGSVLDERTRADMRAAGPVVWLTAKPETLWRRIQRDEATAEQRPDLTATGGRAEVEQLLAERQPLYEQCARLVVDTDELPGDAIARSIHEQIRDEVSGESRTK